MTTSEGDTDMTRNTGITQRSAENGFADPFPVDSDHMSAYACLGMRSAFYHRGFYAQGADGCPSNHWLEVWWTTDTRTGQVTDIFEDTRGLNRR
jgi:hypothetical protein